MITRRVRRVFEVLEKSRVDAAVTFSPADIFYFTGTFASGCAIFFRNGRAALFANSMYSEIFPKAKPLAELKKIKARRLVIEPQKISHKEAARLKMFGGVGRIVPVDNFFSKIRAVKERGEIEKISQAQRISREILKNLRIREGETEIEIFQKISGAIAKRSDGASFSPIVAFGRNSSRPHHIPTNRKFKRGDIALLDIGVKISGYCADLTRIKGLFNIRKPLIGAYKAVVEARNRALAEIKEGTRIGMADEIIREFLEKKGFGGNILHSSGHGVGIEIHEWPPISGGVREEFRAGMVFALEPGLYFRGIGGVRIEDVFMVESGGVRRL